MGKLLVFILLAVVVIVLMPMPKNESVIAGLRAKQSECRENLQKLKTSNFYRSESRSGNDVWITVNEDAWHRMDHDDHVRQGLLVYCAHMPDDGRLSVYVKGSRSGDLVGSVHNGNYSKK